MTSRSHGGRWTRATLLVHLLAFTGAQTSSAQTSSAQASSAQASSAQASSAQAPSPQTSSPQTSSPQDDSDLPARVVIAVDVDGATVLIDGAPIGETPLAAQELTGGEHEITVRAAGYEVFTRRIDAAVGRLDVRLVVPEATEATRATEATEATRLAERDDTRDFDSVESRDPLWRKWWLWAAIGGAALVGLVAGVAVAASGGGAEQGFPVPPIPGRAMP